MTEAEMRQIILSFPGAEDGRSYGQPSFKVNGKFFTRLRSEDDSLVLSDVPIDERELLIEAAPEIFHITPHYKDYPNVLARLAALDEPTLRGFLEWRFRRIAPRGVVKTWEAAQAQRKPR